MIVRRPSGFIEPCLPSKVARPPPGSLWVHEIKHDGYRLMVRRDGSRVRCFTRNGHDWADRFPARFPTGAPPLEMRLMTKERRVGVELADDLPNYSGHSGKFMLKLIAAWIAMGLRRPEITWGKTARGAQ